MSKYRKKPVVIEAVCWTADIDQEPIDWFNTAINRGTIKVINAGTPGVKLEIQTLEGTHTASIGDYIIKGIKGEIYPCKPDIFEATYDKVE